MEKELYMGKQNKTIEWLIPHMPAMAWAGAAEGAQTVKPMHTAGTQLIESSFYLAGCMLAGSWTGTRNHVF